MLVRRICIVPAHVRSASREHRVSEDKMPGELHSQFDRAASKRAVGRLVIQFRVERAAKRVAWFAVATLGVALILSVPGVSRVIVKLMQS